MGFWKDFKAMLIRNSNRRVSGVAPPTNSVAPVVTGTATQGQLLSCTQGTWTGTPSSYAYQWYRTVGGDISGANANTYTLQAGDVGLNVACRVTAINAGGGTSANSNSVGPVATAAPVNSVAPVASGTATTGQVLSVTNGTWSGSPSGYTYQWKRGGTAISGATANTYTLVSADETYNVTCDVTATNAFGSNTAASNALGPVAPAGSYPAGVIAIDTAAGNNVMKNVWDMKAGRGGPVTAGNNAALTHTTSVSGNPAGWSNDPGKLFYGPAANNTTTNVWWDDGQVLTRGGFKQTFTNNKFTNPGSTIDKSKLVGIGDVTTTAADADFNYCTFDGTGMQYYISGSTGAAAFVASQAGGTLNFNNCSFNTAPLLLLKSFATTTNCTDCFFGTFGHDPDNVADPDKSHFEGNFICAGTNNYTRCLFDSSDVNTDPLEDMTTAGIYIEADTSGNVNVAFTNCIFKGAMSQGDGTGIPSYIGLAAKNARTLNITWTNCAIEKGQVGYIITQAEVTGGVVTNTDGGGNKDLNTGVALVIGTKNTL